MCSPGINEERELRGQPANPGSPGKMAVKTECVWVCGHMEFVVALYHTFF